MVFKKKTTKKIAKKKVAAAAPPTTAAAPRRTPKPPPSDHGWNAGVNACVDLVLRMRPGQDGEPIASMLRRLMK